MLLHFVLLSALVAVGTETVFDIRKLITPQQFRSAGLHKLTPEEMKSLNGIVSDFYTRMFEYLQPKGNCKMIIESQIEGEFEGWDGETVFKLTNGQIWQQSSYSYMYSYKYRPEVMIFSQHGQCKMKVEGISDTITVRRLK